MSSDSDIRLLLDSELDREPSLPSDWAARGVAGGRRRQRRRRASMSVVAAATVAAAMVSTAVVRGRPPAVEVASGTQASDWTPRGELASDDMLDAAIEEYEKHGGPVGEDPRILFAGEVRPGDIRIVLAWDTGDGMVVAAAQARADDPTDLFVDTDTSVAPTADHVSFVLPPLPTRGNARSAAFTTGVGLVVTTPGSKLANVVAGDEQLPIRAVGDGVFVFSVQIASAHSVRFQLRPPSGDAYSTSPTDIAIPAQRPQEVAVSLYHCGVNPLVYEGEKYEVVDPPFDGTNAPSTFSGLGTVSRHRLELHYRDRAGATLVFTLDDGGPLPLCS